jgi:hypothetical protein
MARDLAVLLDTIGAEEADLVGYSMGAIVALISKPPAGEPSHPRLTPPLDVSVQCGL